MTDDVLTRLALLERMSVTLDQLSAREDRMLDRFDTLLRKHDTRIEETLEHALKVFGHNTAEQLQKLKAVVNEDQDRKREAAITTLEAKVDAKLPVKAANTSSTLTRWGLPVGVGALAGAAGPTVVIELLRFMSAFAN